jgi:purine-binding chemotaxis protein CheW
MLPMTLQQVQAIRQIRKHAAVTMLEHTHTAADNSAHAPTMQAVLIRLKREYYALPVSSIREIMRHRAYTPVPGAPPTLPGIISQRGVILPVVELRLLLGFEAGDLTGAARYIMVQHNDIDMALVAEEVLDLVELPEHMIEPAPSALEPGRAALLRGILQHEERLIAVFDLDAIIARLREEPH